MQSTERSQLWRTMALLQLVLVVALTLLARCFCGEIHLLGTDLCWLIQATPIELNRAFPMWHRVAFLLLFMLKYGGVALSALFVVVTLLGKQLRQNLVLASVSVVLTTVMAEVALRLVGYRPGQFTYNKWVRPVDSLFVLPGFTTDAAGTTKMDTSLITNIYAQPIEYDRNSKQSFPYQWKYWNEIGSVLMDHGFYQGGPSPSGELWEKYQQLVSSPDRLTARDSVLVNYYTRPFNNQGFYSIEFDTVAMSNDRVLLLGDSFLWGHTTSSKILSFSNILLARGYNVFNTGFSGSDVVQYECVLREYGPRLRPKLVVLNFYMGNDVTWFEREIRANVPFHYHTSAGPILSNQAGVQFYTAKAAYENIMRNMVMPSNSALERLLSKTVVSTKLWEFLVLQDVFESPFFIGQDFPPQPLNAVQMARIKAICDSIGAQLILSVIPNLKDGRLEGAEIYPDLFGGVPYSQPTMSEHLYSRYDGHFNDAGHLFYAEYLELLIDSALQTSQFPSSIVADTVTDN